MLRSSPPVVLKVISAAQSQAAEQSQHFVAPNLTRLASTSKSGTMLVPPLMMIADATLKSVDGTLVVAKTLWEQQPVVFYCIRRPGCVLCRDEAKKLWKQHDTLEAAGIRIVCVVHEWIDQEVNAFVPTYWGGEIYHDVGKALYRTFGRGQVRTASSLSLLDPFSPVWSRISAARKNVREYNLAGQANILGGLLIVKQSGGGIAYMHAEKTFGEFPDTQDILAAATAAVRTVACS